MNFIAKGIAAAVLAAAGFGAAAPASATPMMAPVGVTQSQTGIELAQYRPHRPGYRSHRRDFRRDFRPRRPVCRTQVTRVRGAYGRVIVKRMRVCR